MVDLCPLSAIFMAWWREITDPHFFLSLMPCFLIYMDDRDCGQSSQVHIPLILLPISYRSYYPFGLMWLCVGEMEVLCRKWTIILGQTECLIEISAKSCNCTFLTYLHFLCFGSTCDKYSPNCPTLSKIDKETSLNFHGYPYVQWSPLNVANCFM